MNSEIILSAQTHPGDSSTATVVGSAFKGDGYYGRSDGLHTVQYTFTDLIGTITIQGTLVLEPVEEDWFSVHSYSASSETATRIANFTGNYVFIRAVVTYTHGSVENIKLNH